MNARFETVLAVFLKLVVGSTFAVFCRVILKACSTPSYDISPSDQGKYCSVGEVDFKKGVFLMTVGWLAMVPAILYFWICRRRKAEPSSYGSRAMLLAIIPSVFDMISTVLLTYGAIWVSMSLAFVFKGARVVFSAMLTVFFLKRRLYIHHWTSVVMCVAGLSIAASSQLMTQPSTVVGVFMVLGSEFFKSLRVVFEEKLMKSLCFEPTFLVGIQGIYGTIIFATTLIVVWLGVPGSDDGSFENLPDTLYRISQSSTLISLFCLFPFVTCVASIASVVVTKRLSAMHNAFISVARVGLIWSIELILFYTSEANIGRKVGEPWTDYSWLKLGGFLVVVFSSLLFDEDIKIPCLFNYDHLLAVKDTTDQECVK